MMTLNLSTVWVTYLVCVEYHSSQKILVLKITDLNVTGLKNVTGHALLTATVTGADVHFTTSKNKKLQNKRHFKTTQTNLSFLYSLCWRRGW